MNLRPITILSVVLRRKNMCLPGAEQGHLGAQPFQVCDRHTDRPKTSQVGRHNEAFLINANSHNAFLPHLFNAYVKPDI